jgi:hypothetical protein
MATSTYLVHQEGSTRRELRRGVVFMMTTWPTTLPLVPGAKTHTYDVIISQQRHLKHNKHHLFLLLFYTNIPFKPVHNLPPQLQQTLLRGRRRNALFRR